VTQEDKAGTVSWEVTEGFVELTIGAGAEELISNYVDRSLGPKDSEVTWSDVMEVKEGGEFDCTFVVDGVTVSAHVVQESDKGNVSYKLAGSVIFSEKLSILVEAAFKGKATHSNGMKAKIAVKVNNEDGDVDWSLVP